MVLFGWLPINPVTYALVPVAAEFNSIFEGVPRCHKSVFKLPLVSTINSSLLVSKEFVVVGVVFNSVILNEFEL